MPVPDILGAGGIDGRIFQTVGWIALKAFGQVFDLSPDRRTEAALLNSLQVPSEDVAGQAARRPRQMIVTVEAVPEAFDVCILQLGKVC